jgi:hypothetical protein
MTRADVFKLLGAAIVLAIVVALISPPTKMLPTAAGDWRKQIPVRTGTPVPAGPTGAVPAAALARPPAPAPPVVADEGVADAAAQPAPPAAAADRDDRFLPDDLAERRYRQGYHWAQRNGVEDERDCYREPGDPFADGCLAALRDGDDRRGPAYPPEDGPYRRDGWDR